MIFGTRENDTISSNWLLSMKSFEIKKDKEKAKTPSVGKFRQFNVINKIFVSTKFRMKFGKIHGDRCIFICIRPEVTRCRIWQLCRPNFEPHYSSVNWSFVEPITHDLRNVNTCVKCNWFNFAGYLMIGTWCLHLTRPPYNWPGSWYLVLAQIPDHESHTWLQVK